MQPILDGPRLNQSEALVRGLLQSHSTVRVTYGAVALDSNFGEVADISGYMTSGSTISSSTEATVNRTCSLNIDADVTDTGWSYLSGFVRPYMTLADEATGFSAEFHLGVYTLTTPARTLGTTPAALQFAGYDLMYLLNQAVGDSYEVPAGSDPAQAAADVIGLAIPEVDVIVSPSGSTLTRQLTWPFDASAPVTYLAIVKTLLGAIGYNEVWVDWDGRFRIEPFIDLQDEPYEWTFDLTDSDNVVADGRTQNTDLFTVPNWWRFVIADLTDLPVEGETQFTYEDSSALNPGSTVNRGRTIRHIEMVPATNYDDLVDYAQRTITANIKPSETFSAKTQPFPLAWHRDVIDYRDPSLDASLPLTLAGQRRVVATTWTLPLDGQTDMDWLWQTVTDQTATLGLTTQQID